MNDYLETEAHIHSLNGKMETVKIIEFNDNNNVVAEYKGKRYTAIFNPFVCEYYVDDIYGELDERH